MKSILAALLSLIATTAFAQQISQIHLDQLFGDHKSLEEFNKKFEAARKAKVPLQTCLEAKFVYLNNGKDNKALAESIPEFEKALEDWKPENAFVTGSKEDWNGLISYCKALKAELAEDKTGFKSHISDAFWQNPQQAGLFAEAVLAHKDKVAMESAVVDLKLELIDAANNKTNLGAHLKDGKALLIDFWASWCGPCIAAMPGLKKKSESLAKHGIVVVAMNSEDPQAGGDPIIAEATQKSEKMDKIPWLIEPKGTPYSRLLRIDSIPRMVLVTPEGKVLFNGHPNDPGLWIALRKVDPEIKEPKS